MRPERPWRLVPIHCFWTICPWRRCESHLRIIVGLELDAAAGQPVAQAVVVRERPVVDQAQIEAGGERMRMLGGDRAFRRHSGVADRMAALHLRQPEPVHHVAGQPLLLEQLDAHADPRTRS